MSLLLGVPTLYRYDLLDKMIASAEAGTVKPRGYIVIDNGGGYNFGRWRGTVVASKISIDNPGKNLGVAASWNRIQETAGEPVIIASDDVTLGPTTFAELVSDVATNLMVMSEGMALFAIDPDLRRYVGWFDENYWPAYYEDLDFAYRMKLARIEPARVSPPASHVGSATLRGASRGSVQFINEGEQKNRAYYIQKWGGPPGDERFKAPFDGHPPAGWNERLALAKTLPPSDS